MRVLGKTVFKRCTVLILLAAVLVTAGCKMDLENEIWLNRDGSGRAVIHAYVEYAAADVSEADKDLVNRKVLRNYVKMIEKTAGATLIADKSTNLSDAEYIAASFKVSFRFNNLATLNKILAVGRQTAFESVRKGNFTEFRVYPARLHMIDSGTLTQATPDYGMFDILYRLKVHAPTKITESDAVKGKQVRGNIFSWSSRIDTSWLDTAPGNIAFKY